MSVLLQVNFTPGPSQVAQTEDDKLESARRIAELPGLSWKIWIHDEENTTRGGIYLFDDLAHARDWGEEQLRSRLTEAGASDISIRYFTISEAPSRITRAPLEAHEAADA
ncbi:YdhR family protein [Rhodovastum atsumiense]|nr:YdhR family protein [Rhodovastum atsumiense]CAH2599928.1 YdhR family protein [Rhodovastum atsumiense]